MSRPSRANSALPEPPQSLLEGYFEPGQSMPNPRGSPVPIPTPARHARSEPFGPRRQESEFSDYDIGPGPITPSRPSRVGPHRPRQPASTSHAPFLRSGIDPNASILANPTDGQTSPPQPQSYIPAGMVHPFHV